MEYWAAAYHAEGKGGVCYWSYLRAGKGVFACVLKVAGDDAKASLGYYCMKRLREWARTNSKWKNEALETEIVRIEQELQEWQDSALRRGEYHGQTGIRYLAGCICLDNQCLVFGYGQGNVLAVNRSMGQVRTKLLLPQECIQVSPEGDDASKQSNPRIKIRNYEMEQQVGLLLITDEARVNREGGSLYQSLMPDAAQDREQLQKRLTEFGKHGQLGTEESVQESEKGDLLYVLYRE